MKPYCQAPGIDHPGGGRHNGDPFDDFSDMLLLKFVVEGQESIL